MPAPGIETLYRLTPLQEGILYHVLRSPGTGLYHQQVAWRLDGDVEPVVLRRAWEMVVQRHQVLRTLLTWERRDHPLQIVRRAVELPWTELDWRKLDGAEQQGALEGFLREDRACEFVLDRAPLLRVAVMRLAERSLQCVWSFHHLILDGWSARLVMAEVARIYASLRRGVEPAMPMVRPFEDHISWLSTQPEGAAETFWTAELDGFPGATPFRVDATYRELPWAVADSHSQSSTLLSQATTSALSAAARSHGVTLATVLHGAWGIVLSAYSGQRDIVIGTTVSGRSCPLDGVEDMVGLFINTLPLRLQVDEALPAASWLRSVQTRLAALLRHEHTALVRIHHWCGIAAEDALFDSIVVVENHPTTIGSGATEPGLDDLRFHERSNYPLALLAVPGSELELILVSRNDRFDPATTGPMLRLMTAILGKLAVDWTSPVADLKRATETRDRPLLAAWNRTTAEYPAHASLPGLFEATAATRPDAIAITSHDRTLSYRELDLAADQLARRLRSAGIGEGRLIAITTRRAADTVIGMLGVLKAGAAYVPLDPGYPAARIAAVVADAKIEAMVTTRDLAGQVPAGLTPVLVDQWDGRVVRRPTDGPLPTVSPDAPAYVMYTSGSSGRPKGVIVTHRNLVHSTTARFRTYPERPERFLLLPSLGFDSSVAGLYWTLCAGGTLCLPPEGVERDADEITRVLAAWRISHLLTLPSLYGLVLESGDPRRLASLTTVIVAGESCPAALARRHLEVLPATRLYNEYGPTEATVWSTVHRVLASDPPGPVPIGAPIANTRVHVVDDRLRPVPIGAPGELVIAGDGISPGYLGQPELTAAGFITGLDSETTGVRAFRSGDLVRWRDDGNLEFLGRLDGQVKVRGHRVEPREIELALQRHPGVQEAAVAAVPRAGDGQALVALLARRLAALAPAEAHELLARAAALAASERDRTRPEGTL